MNGWYKNVTGKTHRPKNLDLDTKTKEIKKIFKIDTILPSHIPEVYLQYNISDEIPSWEEIQEAVLNLRSCRATGFSGLRSETLKDWSKLYENKFIKPWKSKNPPTLSESKFENLMEEKEKLTIGLTL